MEWLERTLWIVVVIIVCVVYYREGWNASCTRDKLKLGISDIMRDYKGCDMDNPTEERFAAGLISAVEYIAHGLGYPDWIRIKNKTEEEK